MKKNDFDNRLQNDLFPEMPRSFGRKLTKAMETEGVKIKKRPTATGVFASAVSLVAAAAVLLIVLMGVLSGGRSDRNQAAAPGETAATTPSVTVVPMTWPWSPKVFTLSTGFEFKNEEKLEALYTNILYSLMRRGESEPDELWLCAIKSRYVAADTGDRADGYLSGYYVLVQHSFGPDEGPELYCLSEDFEVLWCTEGSATGPNHAVNPEEDNYTGTYQGHFLYGTEPRIPEPGVPRVTRGALVGSEPGTDVEFSMAASITKVEERLQGSTHLDAAKEFFLITVSAHDWDSVMKNPILRFETLEGPVDVNMEADVPLVHTLTYAQLHSGGVPSSPLPAVVADQTKIVDLTGRTCLTGEPDYGELVLRALATSGVKTPRELWLCAVDPFSENEDTVHRRALILAQYAFEGAAGPELFYYEDGRILWMTEGYEPEGINVVVDENNHITVLFGVSHAYDGRALAMAGGTVTLKNDEGRTFGPVLSLDKVQKIVGQGPNYDYAREFYLCSLPNGEEVMGLTIEAAGKTFTRAGKAVTWAPFTIPAMAVRSDGVVYPGKVTHLAHARGENGLAADGSPLMETLRGTTFEEIKIVRNRDRALPWEIITASDSVTADRVEVYSENLERLYNNAEISVIDSLPAGRYYLCFHTTVLGPYSEKIGKYTYRTDYTIYKVALMGEARLSVTSGDETVEARHLFFVDDPDGDGVTHYLNVDIALEKLPTLLISETHLEMETIPEHDLTVENVIAFNEQMKTVLEGKDPEILHELPKGIYTVCIYARRDRSYELLGKSSMGDVEVFAFGARVE